MLIRIKYIIVNKSIYKHNIFVAYESIVQLWFYEHCTFAPNYKFLTDYVILCKDLC